MKTSDDQSKTIVRLSHFRFGLGVGVAGLVFYLGCVITMMTVPHKTAILFLNSLFQGLDVTAVLRDDIPLTEVLLGMISTFGLCWLLGILIAAMYNACERSGD